jgi:hypothetical protein
LQRNASFSQRHAFRSVNLSVPNISLKAIVLWSFVEWDGEKIVSGIDTDGIPYIGIDYASSDQITKA